jgi:hypothetical protein
LLRAVNDTFVHTDVARLYERYVATPTTQARVRYLRDLLAETYPHPPERAEPDQQPDDEPDAAASMDRAGALLREVAAGLLPLREPEVIYRLQPGEREIGAEIAAGLATTLRAIAEALESFRGEDLRATGVSPADFEDLDAARWCDRTGGGEPTRWPAAIESGIVEHSDAVPGVPGEFVVRFGAAVGSVR